MRKPLRQILARFLATDRQPASEHDKSQHDFETLYQKVIDLEVQIHEPLESYRKSKEFSEELEAQLAFLRQPGDLGSVEQLRGYSDELEAQLAFFRQPDELRSAQQVIAILLRHQKPLPDDFHEQALRLALRENPFDFKITYSLVALLVRQMIMPTMGIRLEFMLPSGKQL